jgi:hypothetical protein
MDEQLTEPRKVPGLPPKHRRFKLEFLTGEYMVRLCVKQ